MADYMDDISIMEDLDPEPEPTGRSYFREFTLGVLLLIAVVSWAGWQSWQQEIHLNSYRVAEQAVSVQDWDSAHRHFLAASDYRDARARAGQIKKLIANRDQHYRAATTAINRKQWATALKELQNVRSVQANYWDVASLYDQAETEVYRNALEGVVALRADGEPPGLYYRAGNEWVWLEGSDRWSQVFGAASDTVVYDIPGEGWQRGIPIPNDPYKRQPATGKPELEGRKLRLATLTDSGVTVRDSTLDPSVYDYYPAAGSYIVAGRYNERPGSFIHSVRSGFNGWWLDYERMEDGQIVSTTLSLGSPDETVMDFSQKNDMYLVAVAGGISVRSSKIEVYLGKMSEGETGRRPVYSHVGQLGGGQLSPDGRHILLTTIKPSEDSLSEVQSVLLFDLVSQTQPYTLTTRTVPVATLGSYVAFNTWVKAVFLAEGEYAGRLLLVDRDGDQITLSLIDPTNPGTATKVAQISGDTNLYYVSEKAGSSDVLISGWVTDSESPFRSQKLNTLAFFRLTPGQQANVAYLPMGEGYYLQKFEADTGHVVYEQRTSGIDNSTAAQVYHVYDVPYSQLGAEQSVPPTQVLTGTWSIEMGEHDVGYSTQNPSWYTGDGLFAYTQGGGLYVREYDGSSEIRLENSVLQLIDPSSYSNINYFR